MEKRQLKNSTDIYSWKHFDVLQQPEWPNIEKYNQVIQKLN